MWIARVPRLADGRAQLPTSIVDSGEPLRWGTVQSDEGGTALVYIDRLAHAERDMIENTPGAKLRRAMTDQNSASLFAACRERRWKRDESISDIVEMRDWVQARHGARDDLKRDERRLEATKRVVGSALLAAVCACLGSPEYALGAYSLLTSCTGTFAAAWTNPNGYSSDAARGGSAAAWSSNSTIWCLNPKFYGDGAAAGQAWFAGYDIDKTKVVIHVLGTSYAGALTRRGAGNNLGYAQMASGYLYKFTSVANTLATGSAASAGDEVALVSEGDSHVGLRNGSANTSATDSGYATGNPGVRYYAGADLQMDWIEVYEDAAAPAGHLLTRLQAEGLFVGGAH